LEEARVLIPDDDWKQGPAHLNALIADLERQYGGGRKRKPPPAAEPVSELLSADALRIALAEWSLNDVEQVMELVPFLDDYRREMSDEQRETLRDLIADLKQATTEMTEDVEDLRINFPAAARLVRDLQRYAGEAAKGVCARPGSLLRYGRNLDEAWLDPEVSKGLGKAMTERLGRLIQQHRSLAQLYLAGALSRTKVADRIRLPEDLTLDGLTDLIARGVRAVSEGDWSRAKPANPRDVAVLVDIADRMERLNAERDLSRDDPARLRQIEDEQKREGLIGGATLVRFGLKSAQVTSTTVAVAADAKTLWPQSFTAVYDALIAALFGGG
ncbi:MAG: hypothetical protein AAFZ09_18655, partial [Pseudomonadota bacterium]